jgi:hypothetical protein
MRKETTLSNLPNPKKVPSLKFSYTIRIYGKRLKLISHNQSLPA